MAESRINNPQRMKQLIDFQGLAVDEYIYPTASLPEMAIILVHHQDSNIILQQVSKNCKP